MELKRYMKVKIQTMGKKCYKGVIKYISKKDNLVKVLESNYDMEMYFPYMDTKYILENGEVIINK